MSMRLFSLAMVAGLVAGSVALAQPSKGGADEKAAIAKRAEAFVAAFHKGDAKALAAFWTPDGTYVEMTGRAAKGRDAIEKRFGGFFALNKGMKVRIEGETLKFLTPDVAVEEGTSLTFPPDGAPPSRAHYVTTHVKKDGQWLLESVRESSYSAPGNVEFLQGLEWAIGDWEADDGMGTGEHLALAWTDNQNFVIGSFAATVKGVSVGRATHWVGWDPQAKRIRSWIFDATGGFGEGSWTAEGDKWTVKTKSVLQDGKNATATFVLSRVDDDTISLQAKERTVDGKAQPDVKEVKLKRVKQ